SWSNADRDARIFRRRKSSRARAKVSRRQLVANIRRAGFDAVKAVVTHLGTPLWEAPQPIQSYPLCPSSALGVSPASLAMPCLLWVKSRHWGTSDRCPLYPRKQTLLKATGMSALCQKRTLRLSESHYARQDQAQPRNEQ